VLIHIPPRVHISAIKITTQRVPQIGFALALPSLETPYPVLSMSTFLLLDPLMSRPWERHIVLDYAATVACSRALWLEIAVAKMKFDIPNV
jgi:hypothetical protein